MKTNLPAPAKKGLLSGFSRIRTFSVWAVFLCMLPGILHYTIFRLIPSVTTAVLSFTDISGLPGSAWTFIGWDNYREFFILQNVRDLKNALSRTGVYSIAVTLIQNSIALAMAILLNNRMLKGRNAYRAVFFLPVILGVTVVSTIWKLMFSTPTGPIFLFLRDVIGVANPPAVLSSFVFAFPAVIASQIWMYMGYSLVIFLAGLQNIPRELYEAAEIDGAGPIQSFTRVTLPMLWSTVTVNTLLALIGSLQSFELIMTITGGQFNTSTLGMMVFATAFGGRGATAGGGSIAGLRQGYAASQSRVLYVAVFLVTVVTQLIKARKERDE